MRNATAQRGISLIEALVALLTLAFGMLAIAGLQAHLRLNSDVAKQRAEATRIAQEDMENFRAFSTVAANAAIANNFAYAQIPTGASSAPVVTATATNTAYTITRSVANSAVTDLKDLVVSVEWVDRNAVTQRVTLRSMIAETDPALAASLAIAPNGSPIRDLLGRDVQVPIPAKNLGDGTSALKPLGGGTVALVLSNDSGLVTRRCTVSATTVTATLTSGDLTSCTNIEAYLVSGFIRFSYGTPDKTSPNDLPPSGSQIAMRVDLDDTAPASGTQGSSSLLASANWPAVTGPTGSNASYSPPECSTEALKTVIYDTPVNFTQTNNNTTTTVTTSVVVAVVPQTVNGPPYAAGDIAPHVGIPAAQASSKIQNPRDPGQPARPERYVSYICLIYPLNLDADITTPNAFTARVAVWPTAGWTIGTSNSTVKKICRYSSDYNRNGFIWTTNGGNVAKIDNTEHPYAYLNSSRSLSNQNYLVIDGDRLCPTDTPVEVDGTGGENYTDETTVLHQPAT